MSTDYLVKCPHASCQWSGNLPANPSDNERRGTAMNVHIVTFQCPRCLQPWTARRIGDDLETLPWETDEDPTFSWPPVDLGVGD
jgi:hypothetical protein